MTRDNPGTLDYFIGKFKDARIVSSDNGGMELFSGIYDFHLCGGFVCTLGNVTVGTKTGGTTVYSFAPDTEKPQILRSKLASESITQLQLTLRH